jgi:hypothetical protein
MTDITFEEFDLNNPAHVGSSGVWAVARPGYLKLFKRRADALNCRTGYGAGSTPYKLYELEDGRWEHRGTIGGPHDPICDSCRGRPMRGSWRWKHVAGPRSKIAEPLASVYVCSSCAHYV